MTGHPAPAHRTLGALDHQAHTAHHSAGEPPAVPAIAPPLASIDDLFRALAGLLDAATALARSWVPLVRRLTAAHPHHGDADQTPRNARERALRSRPRRSAGPAPRRRAPRRIDAHRTRAHGCGHTAMGHRYRRRR